MVARLAGIQLVETTHRIEMAEGEGKGMMAIVIGMRCAATEIMAETETETARETVAVIDEARVKKDAESLRLGEMIHLLHRRGEVEGEGKVGPMYLLRFHLHRQCTGRTRDGDMDLDLDPRKDRVEVVIAGVMMVEKTQATAAMLEVEMTTCHRGSTHEGKMAHRMGEGEAHAGQAKSRGHGEDREHTTLSC